MLLSNRGPLRRVAIPLIVTFLVTFVGTSAMATPLTWITMTDDWFDFSSWAPAAVPTAADTVTINNGGTAEIGSDTLAEAMSVGVGTDGGTGTLRLLDSELFDVLSVGDGLDIGVTTAGTNTSTGTLELAQGGHRGIIGNADARIRLGFTETGGEADGTLDADTDVSVFQGIRLTELLLGVSEGIGQAMAEVDAPDLVFDAVDLVEIGVARNAGDATADIEIEALDEALAFSVGVSSGGGTAEADFLPRRIGTLDANTVEFGVASAGGSATATLPEESYILRFEGDGSGDFSLGVSLGSGQAEGSLYMNRDSGSTVSIGSYDSVRIGVAESTGDATGTLVTAGGIDASSLEIGIGTGSGTATGAWTTERGSSTLSTFEVGAGSTLQLGIKGISRGTSSPAGHAAIDTATADLAVGSTLIAELAFVPEAGQRFELLNSASMTGISGTFSTVEVPYLNQAQTATPSLVVDSGVEKFVLDISGAPARPDFMVASGDWFDAAAWSSPLVPGPGDPATVANGGTVGASSATAPGAVEAFSLVVGADGQDGSADFDGVELMLTHGATIGLVSADHLAGGTTTGSATWTAPTFRLAPVFETDLAADPERYRSGLGIAIARGQGTADGSLSLTGGSLLANEDGVREPAASGLLAGIAHPVGSGTQSTAVADLQIQGSGIGSTRIEPGETRIAHAETADASATAIATAGATINRATTGGDLWIAAADCDGAGSSAMATATSVTLSRADHATDSPTLKIADATENSGSGGCVASAEATLVTFENFDASPNIFDVGEADSWAGTISATADIVMTDVVFSTPADGSATIDIAEPSARAVGGSATTTVDWQMSRVVIDAGSGLFQLGETEGSAGTASATVTATATESALSGNSFVIGEVAISGSEGVDASSDVDFSLSQGSTLAAEHLEIGRARANGVGSIVLDADLRLTDSIATVGGDTIVGWAEEDRFSAESRVAAALWLDNSQLTSDRVLVGTTNEPGIELDAKLDLNPSLVDTENLHVGPDGELRLHASGFTRVTSDTLGAEGTYATIDAADALLEGEIVVEFDFIPSAGAHTFDLIVTDSTTALDDFAASVRVEDLYWGFEVTLFGVITEDTDILCLIISGSPTPPLFADGFESGNTSAWFLTTP